VVRHFLACVSKDAQGDETTIKIEIANEKVCVDRSVTGSEHNSALFSFMPLV
jgi:DNA topoisomerase IA